MIRTLERDDREREWHVEGGPGGWSFWAVTRTAITAIQLAFIAPSTTSIAISPGAGARRHSPNPKPDPGPLVGSGGGSTA
jgi:hypothetical protein